MVANVLTDLFIEDFVDKTYDFSAFLIEVNDNFVTVDRKHQHTSLIESKTVKVDKDVIVYLHEVEDDVVDLECRWLWRDSTIFEKLSNDQALKLQNTIIQISNSQRRAGLKNIEMGAIRVGDQIWSSCNLDIEMGIESKEPTIDGKHLKNFGLLYTYRGAEKIISMFPEWRIPTVSDYLQLMDFFNDNFWKELTGHMEFKLAGFHSDKISKSELDQFLGLNPALKSRNGGFFWTSDVRDYNPRNAGSGMRNYIYFNKFTKRITSEQSVNANDNMFSLRLIKR